MNLVIDSNGKHVKNADGTYKTSDHPAYQARVELALAKGSWLCAPSAGHNLDKFKNQKQTTAKVDAFMGEVNRYLAGYEPVVLEGVAVRENFTASIQIDEE